MILMKNPVQLSEGSIELTMSRPIIATMISVMKNHQHWFSRRGRGVGFWGE
jgi:hypothetical protein